MSILFTLSVKDDFVILKSDLPYENVAEILGWEEDISELSVYQPEDIKKEFRWSSDQNSYSQWIELTENNLENIRFSDYSKFWVEFQYTLLNDADFIISSVKLLVKEINTTLTCVAPVAYALEKGQKHYPLRIRDFTYNPYRQTKAIRLQQDLSYMANSLYGHEVTYFKAIPKTKSRDVIFLEWSLSDVTEPKCIKVLVPNNEFPDNKFNFNVWGADFEIPFEIHIDKRYFEHIFGLNTMPQRRDIIYFNIANRIYEVDSAQPVKDFMQSIVYYKVSLKKYVKRSSRIESEEVRNIIDEVTTGVEEMFGEEIKAEIESTTNTMQTVDKTAHYDAVREFMNTIDFSVQETIENYHTTISQYYYDMEKLVKKEKEYTTGVRYKSSVDFQKNNNISYTCWFRKPTWNQPYSKLISSITKNNYEITVKFNSALPEINAGLWMEIINPANENWELFGKVISVDQTNLTITMIVPEYILQIAEASIPDWTILSNLSGRQIARRNFIHGYHSENNPYELYSIYGTDGKGIIVDIFKDKLMRIVLNDISYWIEIDTIITPNQWYSMVINISNKFNQLSVHIWKPQAANLKTTKLSKVFEYIQNNIPNIDRSTDQKYEIKASHIHLTNIRVLNEPIEPEKQSLFLNQSIVKDSQWAYIIDNAEPRMRLPYMGDIK